MFTIILSIIFAVIIFTFIFFKNTNWEWDPNYISSAILSGFIGCIVGIAIAIIIGVNAPNEYFISKRVDIISLDDGTKINGNFILGSGTIDQESYYIFYEISPNGAISQHKLSVSDTYIYEDQDSSAFINYYKLRLTGCKDWGLKSIFINNDRYNEIHVPKGTIIRQFNLDLN